MIELMYALIIGGFTGWLAGYMGSLMLTKRMALAGGALGHLTLPGITLALIYGFDVTLGALAFLILGITLIWFFEKKTKQPMEALTAVVFASSVAVAFLFLKQEQVVPALIGDVSKLTIDVVIATAFASIAIFLIVKRYLLKMTLINISRDLAISEGINVDKYNLLYLACVAVTVAIGVRIVGGLMTAAIVAIPAVASRIVSRTLKSYVYTSAFFGALACVAGILMNYATGLPAGPMIIISNAVIFFIAALKPS